MARLTALLKSKALTANGSSEQNVEVGQILAFYPGRTCTGINSGEGFCHVFRTAGTAIVEIWVLVVVHHVCVVVGMDFRETPEATQEKLLQYSPVIAFADR